MFRRLWLLLVVLILLLPQTAAAADKSYSAEQFNQDITIQQDGSMLVRETIIFSFTGGPFTYVYRDLPTDKTDGIVIQSAEMDERVLPPGTQAGQVEIEKGDSIKTTWHFAPVSNQRHTFVLTYRVLGVIQQTDNADWLNWEVLPDDYDYTIHASTTVVHYPEQVTLLDAPQVTTGTAQVSTSQNAATFRAQDISEGTHLEISLRFPTGSLIREAPHWQQLQEQARGLIVPYLLGGLALFLVLLCLVVLHYRRSDYRSLPVNVPAGNQAVPPDELPPALVGAVLSPSNTLHWDSALATLFDLAGKGVLVIAQAPISASRHQSRPDFRIEQQSQPEDLQPYELGLLSALYEGEAHPSLAITKLNGKYTSQRRHFTRPLRQEMIYRGLLDEQRERTRSRMIGVGAGLFFLALIVSIVTAVLAGPGLWPIIFLPIGIGLVGIVTLILWTTFTPLSSEGQREAAQWRAFANFLRETSHRHEPVSNPEMFGAYLVYAASCGLIEPWVKFFQRHEMMRIPSWFHALTSADGADATAFAEMIAVSHTVASSHSGSGVSAGAAGGGSSGAG